jgi:MFS transporter, OFA family, oxalate/formate antiporter
MSLVQQEQVTDQGRQDSLDWTGVRTVVGAALGMSVGFAAVFLATFGVFADPVREEFGWGAQTGGLSFAAASLGVTLACPVAGRCLDRFGVRRVTVCCGVGLAGLLALMSVQSGSALLWVSTSLLLGLVGAATTVLGYLAVLPQWFDRRLGLAIGCAMLGLGAGNIAAPLVAQSLVEEVGWREAYRALAACTLVGTLVATLLIRERRVAREAVAPVPDGQVVGPVAGARRRLGTIFLSALLVSTGTLFLGPHLSGLLRERGLEADLVGQALALTGVGVLVGRLLTGILLDRLHAPFVATSFFVAGALGCVLMAGATQASTALLAAALLGLAIGAEGDLLSYLVRVYLGLTDFGRNYGIAFAGYGLGAVVGPVGAGVYIEQKDSYGALLVIAPVLLLVAAGLLISLGRYARPQDSAAVLT